MVTKLMTWLIILIAVCVIVLAVLWAVRWLRQSHIKDLVVRLELLEKELSVAAGTDTLHARDAASLCVRARYLTHQVKTLADRPIPEDSLAEFEADVDRWHKGLDVFSDKRGAILKGYVSDIDGAIQSYSVNVPNGYLADCRIPLLVSLHGHGWFTAYQEHPATAYTGAITLAPHGRGATDYLYIGEEDVLRAIAEVVRDYPIDQNRIYLTGNSMGGTGTWTVAAHHPDLFAGIAPRAGNADYHAWESRWNWNPSLPGLHSQLRRYLQDLDNPLSYASNLANTPIYCLHNASDQVVPVDHARAMVEAVRSAGADCRYLEMLSGDHGSFDKTIVDEQLGWVASHKRSSLDKVAFTAGRLRHGEVAWVRIEGFERPMALARVQAEVTSDNHLLITCENVSALSLKPPRQRDTFAGTVNGTPFTTALAPDGRLHLHLENGRWAPGGTYDVLLSKRIGVEGPVDEVLLSPFIVVHGTQGADAQQLQAVFAEADRFASEWWRRYNAPPRRKADTEVTEDDLQRCNMVLFGRPDQNSILARYADRLPIAISPDSIQAFGARLTGTDAGTIFCYPNPDNPGRMLVVFAALGQPGYYQVNNRFDNWFNWGVFDSRKWFDYAIYDARTRDPETFVKVGFFDESWNYDPRYNFDAVEDLRAQAPPQHFPDSAVPDPKADLVYLSDVRPVFIDQMRGAVEFDRSFRGENIIIAGSYLRRGLGVRAPSTVRYDIGGGFKTLRATAGLSTEAAQADSTARRKHESVRFVVVGDGKVLWQSDVVDWTSPRVDVQVPVVGVKVLELRVVPEGKQLWLHGSTAWGDARLIR